MRGGHQKTAAVEEEKTEKGIDIIIELELQL